MTTKVYSCKECGINIAVTRPPVYLTLENGTKITYDYAPEPLEYCPKGHRLISK